MIREVDGFVEEMGGWGSDEIEVLGRDLWRMMKGPDIPKMY